MIGSLGWAGFPAFVALAFGLRWLVLCLLPIGWPAGLLFVALLAAALWVDGKLADVPWGDEP